MSNSMIAGNIQASGVVSVFLTPAATAANTTAQQTFTVPGLKVGDFVSVNAPAVTAGTGLVYARVTAPDTIGITFANNTAAPLTAAAGVYLVQYVRQDGIIRAVSA